MEITGYNDISKENINQTPPVSPRTSSPKHNSSMSFEVNPVNSYEDWKRYLHHPTGKFKVRGLRNPPPDFISGCIIFKQPTLTRQKIDEAISYGEPNDVLNRRLSPNSYAACLETRNRNITEKIRVMLHRNLGLIMKTSKGEGATVKT